ncbi:hypothetical protein JFP838_pA0186 (plasmid) [Clostridium perfringens]|uniref:Uncharacterized protein n=1 Tax=Clostridium perfringens TaxID=1502 RepID=A0A140GRE3_CLOPF|nr:hypothetical protein JFP838_pA0186 [Clostridium perfringens]
MKNSINLCYNNYGIAKNELHLPYSMYKLFQKNMGREKA